MTGLETKRYFKISFISELSLTNKVDGSGLEPFIHVRNQDHELMIRKITGKEPTFGMEGFNDENSDPTERLVTFRGLEAFFAAYPDYQNTQWLIDVYDNWETFIDIDKPLIGNAPAGSRPPGTTFIRTMMPVAGIHLTSFDEWKNEHMELLIHDIINVNELTINAFSTQIQSMPEASPHNKKEE